MEKNFYISLQNDLCLELLKKCSIEEFRVILGVISKCNSFARALSKSKEKEFWEELQELNEYSFTDDYGEGIKLKDIKDLIRKQTNADFKLLLENITLIELHYIRRNKKNSDYESIDIRIFENLYIDDEGALNIKFNDRALDLIFNIENEYRIDKIDLFKIKKCDSKYKIYMYLYYLKHKNINKCSTLTIKEVKRTFNLENKALSRNIDKALNFLNDKLDIKNSNEKVKSKKDNKTLIGLQIKFI